jgi:hypothetical protein
MIVQALVRRSAAGGASAFVMHRGDDERGSLYVKVSMLDGRAKLLGPPPAAMSRESDDQALIPHVATEGTAEADVDSYMRSQIDFDPDLWLIEIEDRAGRTFQDG